MANQENLSYLVTGLQQKPFGVIEVIPVLRPDLLPVLDNPDVYNYTIDPARMADIKGLALSEDPVHGLSAHEKRQGDIYIRWLTDGGTVSGRAGIAGETTNAINNLIDRLRGAYDPRLVAQLLSAFDRWQKAKEFREEQEQAKYATRFGEQNAPSRNTTIIVKGATNRQGNVELAREEQREKEGRQRRSRRVHERLCKIVNRDIINLQAGGRDLSFFWMDVMRGRKYGMETPMEMIFPAYRAIEEYTHTVSTNLEAKELERAVATAPTGEQVETLLNICEVPVRIYLLNADGSIQIIDEDVGPKQAANWLMGNEGNLAVGFRDANPVNPINNGLPFTYEWAQTKLIDVNANGIIELKNGYRDTNPTNPLNKGNTFSRQWALDHEVDIHTANITEVKQVTFYTHPNIDQPFTAEFYNTQTNDWKVANGLVDSTGNVLSFSALTQQRNCRMLLDNDPLDSFKVMHPGDLYWTKGGMHREATNRGPWVNGLKEHIQRKYHLEDKWIDRIVYISGNDVQFQPFQLGTEEDDYHSGKELWNQAMGNYYAAFVDKGTQLLMTLGHTRMFDAAFLSDELPDPVRKMMQYLIYVWHYGILPEYARFFMMSDHEDVLGTNVDCLPMYAAINGTKNFQLRHIRPIHYNDRETTIDPLHDSNYGTDEEKLPILKPLYAKNPDGSRRELNDQEKRALMDLVLPRRVSGLEVTDVMSTLDKNVPTQWRYANEVVHLCDRIENAIKDHPGNDVYKTKALTLLENKLSKLADQRQNAELEDPYYSKRPKLFHVASKQDLWGRYQQMSQKIREIIAPIQFNETLISMAGDVPINPDETAGWVGCGHWLELNSDLSEFMAGNKTKIIQKRGIKYALMTLEQANTKMAYIKATIQAIPRTYDKNLGVEISPKYATDDLVVNAVMNSVDQLLSIFDVRNPKGTMKYLEDMVKVLVPAADKGQLDSESARWLAINLVLSNYMISAGYAAPEFEPEKLETIERDTSGIGEIAPLLKLNPNSKVHEKGRAALLAAGYQVRSTEQGYAVITDRSGEAIMRQKGSVELADDLSSIDYKYRIKDIEALIAYGHIKDQVITLCKNQLIILKDAGIINQANQVLLEKEFDALSARFEKAKVAESEKDPNRPYLPATAK